MLKVSFSLIIFLLISSTYSFPEIKGYAWRDLTTKELNQWYTQTDLCMMTLDNMKQDANILKDHRQRNCSKFSHGVKHLKCGVGIIYKYIVKLIYKSYFFFTLSINIILYFNRYGIVPYALLVTSYIEELFQKGS